MVFVVGFFCFILFFFGGGLCLISTRPTIENDVQINNGKCSHKMNALVSPPHCHSNINVSYKKTAIFAELSGSMNPSIVNTTYVT